MNSLRVNNTSLKGHCWDASKNGALKIFSRCSPFPLELVFPFHHREVSVFYINIAKYFNITSIFITTKICFVLVSFCLIIPSQSDSPIPKGKRPGAVNGGLSASSLAVALYLLLSLLLSGSVVPSLLSQNRGKLWSLPSRSLGPGRASRKLSCSLILSRNQRLQPSSLVLNPRLLPLCLAVLSPLAPVYATD